MDNEAVKNILAESLPDIESHYNCWQMYKGQTRDELAKQICQLFEPKETDAIECLEEHLKPSESRLLTPDKFRNAQMRARQSVYLKNHIIPVCMSLDEHSKLSAQRDLTASIKDQEKKGALQVAHDAATFLANDECQQKLKRIKRAEDELGASMAIVQEERDKRQGFFGLLRKPIDIKWINLLIKKYNALEAIWKEEGI